MTATSAPETDQDPCAAALNVMAQAAWQTAEDKGFHASRTEIGTALALIHSEITEALEVVRDGADLSETWYRPKDLKPEGFGMELADAIIRIFDLAVDVGITDLGDRLVEKMNFNAGRPFMHGRTI